MRWLGGAVALVAAILPPLAFAMAMVLVSGHASIAYFEAVAQIIPIVILALAIELRYFSPSRGLPEPLDSLFRRSSWVRVIGVAYPPSTLFALVLSEAVALWVLAERSSSQLQLSITTAGLTAGAVALVLAILLPTTDERGGGT